MTGVVEGFVIGAVIGGVTNLLTDGIYPLLQNTRTAVRCQKECQKLAEAIESIKTDVEHIKGQLEELQGYDPDVKQDLRIVDKSVEKLKEELHLADIEVHECKTASKFVKNLGGCKLSKKITAHNEKITALGRELVQVNLLLTNMLKDAKSRCSSMEMHQRLSKLELQQRANSMELQQQPSMDLHRWNREKEDILQREDSTRFSQLLMSGYSDRSDFGSSSPPLPVDDSSQLSSHHLINHNSGPSQYHRSFTASTHHVIHPDAQYRRSHTTQNHDHKIYSEGVQVSFPDPFVPHLLL